MERGRFADALEILDEAVRHADTVGFAAFHARALVNRGRAKQGIGRFEEAMADFTAARGIYERIGSPSVALALTREGSMHALRGDAFLARAAFENAIRAASDANDSQALAPALIGLAQTIVFDDPEQAGALADQAMDLGRDVAPVTILLGAARVALSLGDRDRADRYAAEAIDVARARRDDPGMAASLELAALTALDPDDALRLVDEAATIWNRSPAPYGYARNRLVFARIAGGEEGHDAAVEAERIFRSIGARGPASDASEIIEAISAAGRPTLRIQSLGRFRLVRDGEAVPTTAWQSKKARDLLKILVARRGRATTRDTFFELLWPDDDPEPLGNRLSVALATVRSVLDPEKRYPAEYFVPADKGSIALDLDHIELDVEAFLTEAAAASRLARERRQVRSAVAPRACRGPVRRRLPRGGPVRGLGGRAPGGGPGDLHLDRPVARRGRRRGRRRRRSHPLLPPDPRARRLRRRRPPRARVRARRSRSPRRGPSPLRLLRGEDGGDRRRGGAVPRLGGCGPPAGHDQRSHGARRRLTSSGQWVA